MVFSIKVGVGWIEKRNIRLDLVQKGLVMEYSRIILTSSFLIFLIIVPIVNFTSVMSLSFNLILNPLFEKALFIEVIEN